MSTESVYEYLERIANLIRTDVRKTAVGHGLQPVQMEALHYLSRCNRYSNTPIAVAEFLGLTKGTVSQTLGVLEANGLIEKRSDTNDRRVVHLYLTDAGADLVGESIPPQIIKAAADSWSESEAAQIQALLNGILRDLQRANALKTFGACQTCRHHELADDGARKCGLTLEPLSLSDAEKICREHIVPADPPVRKAG